MALAMALWFIASCKRFGIVPFDGSALAHPSALHHAAERITGSPWPEHPTAEWTAAINEHVAKSNRSRISRV